MLIAAYEEYFQSWIIVALAMKLLSFNEGGLSEGARKAMPPNIVFSKSKQKNRFSNTGTLWNILFK